MAFGLDAGGGSGGSPASARDPDGANERGGEAGGGGVAQGWV